MSREIEVRKWCDACASEIGESDGTVEPAVHELVITARLDSIARDARLLDLCERHAKGLWGPFSELLVEYGTSPDAPVKPARKSAAPSPYKPSNLSKSAPGPWLCLCGDESATALELMHHVREAHKTR